MLTYNTARWGHSKAKERPHLHGKKKNLVKVLSVHIFVKAMVQIRNVQAQSGLSDNKTTQFGPKGELLQV